MSILSIALLQLSSPENLKENHEKAVLACRKAKEMGADIALFPEMWSNGYRIYDRPVADWMAEAIDGDGDYIRSFSALAKELDMAIGITLLEKCETGPKNAMILFDRHGEKKIHCH